MDADHGFPSRVKSDRLGMLLSDRHGCYYVIGMNVIERSPCVGICIRLIKRKFGFVKARFNRLRKNVNQLAMLFTLANLFRVDQMIRA